MASRKTIRIDSVEDNEIIFEVDGFDYEPDGSCYNTTKIKVMDKDEAKDLAENILEDT